MWRNVSIGRDRHVMPVDDWREHIPSAACWCGAWRLPDDDRIVVHNALDRRETYETGRPS